MNRGFRVANCQVAVVDCFLWLSIQLIAPSRLWLTPANAAGHGGRQEFRRSSIRRSSWPMQMSGLILRLARRISKTGAKFSGEIGAGFHF
jgi:hypothetical protein